MRGPSSSHSAAANRIGRISRNLVEEPIQSRAGSTYTLDAISTGGGMIEV